MRFSRTRLTDVLTAGWASDAGPSANRVRAPPPGRECSCL